MHRQMADMMKAMGGKGKGGGMMRKMMGGMAQKMGLAGGMGGMGGMPDLSKMDPKQLEALQKQAEAAGLGKGLPGGLPGWAAADCPALGGPKLPGLGGGLPGPAEEEVRGGSMSEDVNDARAQLAGLPPLDRQFRRGADPYAGRALPLHQGGRRRSRPRTACRRRSGARAAADRAAAPARR